MSCVVALFPSRLVQGQARPVSDGTNPKSLPFIDSTWPGVRYVVYRIERIMDDRLLVTVIVMGTNKVPASGIMLASRPASLPDNSPGGGSEGAFNPRPFSLENTVLIDDQTGERYSHLPPVAPPGHVYPSALCLSVLHAGETDELSLQFRCPPPLPPGPGGAPPPVHTLSFEFPKAVGLLKNVPLPPPSAPPN